MNNVTPLVSKDKIKEQACEWISRIDRGLSKPERTALIQWVNKGEQYQTALFEMAALWDDLSVMHELSGLFPLAEKLSEERHGNGYGAYAKRPFFAMAASFFLLCAVFLVWMQLEPVETSPQKQLHARQVYSTSVGEQKTIPLSDGSFVALNTNSAIEVQMTDSLRTIEVTRGEAHFEVASDAERPFVVSAGQNKVTAIGTAFNVQLLEDRRFELLVTEGKVLVSEINQSMPDNIHKLKSQDFTALGTIMVSGDTAVFDGVFAQPLTRLSLDQVQKNLSWQQGMLVFQGETLENAIKEMNRYSAKQFILRDESIKTRRVAGYFKVGDTDGLLHALENNFSIEHQKQGEEIFLHAAQTR